MVFNAREDNEFKCRQALEALRNGVPNREAVEILGCNQPDTESGFDEMLQKAGDTVTPPESTLGMLVAGDFGSGKSHLLSYFEHRALDQGFVCSRVAISKETPLYNLGKVFISAIQHARLSGRTGQLMEEIGDKLNDRHSRDYSRFSRWVNSDDSGLHAYFPATLKIHEDAGDLGLCGDVESFWAGEPIRAARVREGLRMIGQQRSFSNFKAPVQSDLPPQRLRFATELIKGAGYKGWVVLLDELELVGSYSLLQRARSYSELARWLGKTPGEQYPGLIVVGTVTEGFRSEVLGRFGKNDVSLAANRLRERNEPDQAARAEAGIRLLEGETKPLRPLSEADFKTTLEKLRLIYTEAYNWDTPDVEFGARGSTYQNTIRYKVRACINEWDLLRLFPGAKPETEGTEFRQRYDELPELEQEVKDDEPRE